MTDVTPQKEQKEEEQQFYGHILIRFFSPGSVFFDFEVDGIVPMQMIVIGEYLSTLGKGRLLQEQANAEREAEDQKIQIAKAGINPKVWRSGLSQTT